MSLLINGNEPDSVTIDGSDVESVSFNGNTIWEKIPALPLFNFVDLSTIKLNASIFHIGNDLYISGEPSTTSDGFIGKLTGNGVEVINELPAGDTLSIRNLQEIIDGNNKYYVFGEKTCTKSGVTHNISKKIVPAASTVNDFLSLDNNDAIAGSIPWSNAPFSCIDNIIISSSGATKLRISEVTNGVFTSRDSTAEPFTGITGSSAKNAITLKYNNNRYALCHGVDSNGHAAAHLYNIDTEEVTDLSADLQNIVTGRPIFYNINQNNTNDVILWKADYTERINHFIILTVTTSGITVKNEYRLSMDTFTVSYSDATQGIYDNNAYLGIQGNNQNFSGAWITEI